ncbi:hypothetical protein M407DRAFT_199226 [Tulasnella calospora MUT 4182]|uniref:DRBM domain-containing protein n=1 Tax=Tulasnella calospora MUT 4182 TaxID=1051891 RepID=A0A0C3LHD3_9AGAM|nr:hypothetical protein M407DRAFT_199226 [Tulasnella calospora MUT 4182]
MLLNNLKAQRRIFDFYEELDQSGPQYNPLWTCRLTGECRPGFSAAAPMGMVLIGSTVTLLNMEESPVFTGGGPRRIAAQDVASRRALRWLGYPGV